METGQESDNPVLEGREPVARMTYLTDELADRAERFISQPRTQPFFLYLAFNAVHTPMEATQEYLARHAGIPDERRRTYAAMVAAMDDAIGRTVDALRAAGLEENTLIFFFNDNGGPAMATTTVNGSSNAPLRGSKRQTWEGGIRVPFIIRWKGHLGEGVVESRPIIQLDVFPTALAAAGIQLPEEWQLDGVDLMPFLAGGRTGPPHETLYWRLGAQMAVRKGHWKLVRSREGPLQPGPVGDLSDAELYNLAEDPAEQRDLSSSHAALVRQLTEDWQHWNRELPIPLWAPGRRSLPERVPPVAEEP
jgi:arylsulfatase A-like enzyme